MNLNNKRLNIIYRVVGVIVALLCLHIVCTVIYNQDYYIEKINISPKNITKDDNGIISVKCTVDTEGKVKQPVLILKQSKCGYVVKFDNKVICNRNDDNSKYSYGIEYVSIPEDYKGHELSVYIYPKENKKNVSVKSFYILSESDYSFLFIQNVFLRSAAALLVIVCGVIFALCILSGKMDEKNNNTLKWMGLFCICGGMWILISSGMLIIFGISYKTMYIAEYISLYMAVYSVICYWEYEIEFSDRQKKIINIMKIIMLIYFADAIILHITGAATLYSVLYIFYLMSAVIGIYMFVNSIVIRSRNLRVSRKMISDNVIAVIIMVCVVYVLEMVRLKRETFYLKNDFTPYIILYLSILSIIRYINRALEGYVHEYQMDSLNSMAYTDIMTGIGNRNSCEKYFADIMEDTKEKYLIVMFDINGLKRVNDELGHSEGDNLIKTFADLLKGVFVKSTDFIGRMGGDEFVLITRSTHEETINLLDKLDNNVAEENVKGKNKFDITYSYGIAECNRKNSEDVWKKFSEADEKMYRVKKSERSK